MRLVAHGPHDLRELGLACGRAAHEERSDDRADDARATEREERRTRATEHGEDGRAECAADRDRGLTDAEREAELVRAGTSS